MTPAAATEAMIAFYAGKKHDINHFLKVYSFAKTIGQLEGLDEQMQLTLEIAAIVHDIPCPLCREKYGSTDGKLQEQEGPALAEAFLQPLGFAQPLISRVAWLVGHHHTYTDVDGLDHQILLEADFLVNADEHNLPTSAIEQMHDCVFQTASGKRILESMYLNIS